MRDDSRYIHVIQLIRITGMNEAKVSFIKNEDILADDPLDAMWFDTYDAALKYRTYMERNNCFGKFTYEPGSMCVMTFRVNATLLGQMPTLKSKPWYPRLVQEELLAQEVKDASGDHGQDEEPVTTKTLEKPVKKLVVTGNAMEDITKQTFTKREYAISACKDNEPRMFYSPWSPGNFNHEIRHAKHIPYFSDALDTAERLKKCGYLDIQIHEVNTVESLGRTVKL